MHNTLMPWCTHSQGLIKLWETSKFYLNFIHYCRVYAQFPKGRRNTCKAETLRANECREREAWMYSDAHQRIGKKEFIQAANRMSSSNYYSSILRHRTMLNLINLCIILCCTLQRFHFFPLIYICIRNFQSEAKNIVKICWLLLSCRSLFTLSLLFVPYTFGSASQEKKFWCLK